MRCLVRAAALVVCSVFAPFAAHAVTPPAPPEQPVLHLSGFSDFDFVASDKEFPGATSGFRNGQFVLHLTSTLSPRFGFFGEVSFSAHDTEYSVEIERSILKYRANDYLGLSFGRYHTPINWWNTAFHHGQWLQTTVDRPEMTRFGGTYIPVHFVGAVAQGVTPLLGSDLNYEAGVGNGRADSLSRAGDSGDANNDRAWFGVLAIHPNALYPLDVGGGFYRDRVERHDGLSFREEIAAMHAVWTKENPEILAEAAHVHHQDLATGASYGNWASYAQLAYRLPWNSARFKPYGRVEWFRVDDNDPVFSSLSDMDKYLGGVRCDAAEFVAFKVECQRLDFKKGPDVTTLLLQVSCTF